MTRWAAVFRSTTGFGAVIVRWVITAFCVLSYWTYSTAGFDFEWRVPDGVMTRYVRMRWDKGSTWLGYADQITAKAKSSLDWFDPGGTLPTRPTLVQPRTRLESFGIWLVTSPENDPYIPSRYSQVTDSWWVGIPSWFVVVVLWWPKAMRIRRRWASNASTH